MKLLYKPFGIILGIARRHALPSSVFNCIWWRIDDEEPPKATTIEDASLAEGARSPPPSRASSSRPSARP